jgi:hypothetical protein
MSHPSHKRAAAKPSTKAKEPQKRSPGKRDTAADPGHKQRFEQLLDDVVLGVPPKR